MGLFDKLKNVFREQKDKAEKAMSDPVRDGKFAIQDSKKQVSDFREQLIKLNAEDKRLQREVAEKKDSSKKYSRMATSAVEKGNDEDALSLLQKKESIDKEVSSLSALSKKNQSDILTARKQIATMNTKIQTAESNHRRLSVNLEQAKIRKGLAAASSKISQGDSPLASLNALEDAVAAAESEADALEEEVSLEPENIDAALEDKYGDDSSGDAQDALAKLKDKMAKNSVTT